MEFTGERFVPSEQGELRLEHYHRYAVAVEIVQDRAVLDVACGEGYGSSLLANYARSVVGVDVSAESVRHAQATYSNQQNLSFVQAGATSLPMTPDSFDVVVSFETIEHLLEQAEMLAEIRRVLRPDGCLIISSPNRPVYSADRETPNEFHVAELDFEELHDLLSSQFGAVKYYGQQIEMGSVVRPRSEDRDYFKAWHDNGSQLGGGCGRASAASKYFLAVCGSADSGLPCLSASVLYPDDLDLAETYRGFARWAQSVDKLYADSRSAYAEITEKMDEQAVQLSNSRLAVAEARAELASLGEARKFLEAELEQSQKVLLERDTEIASMAVARKEWEAAKLALEQWALELNSLVETHSHAVSMRDQQIFEMENSTSWKLTRPMRYAVTLMRGMAPKVKGILLNALRAGFHSLPVSHLRRQRLKSWVYSRIPSAFENTLSYNMWRTQARYDSPLRIQAEKPVSIGDAFSFNKYETPTVSIVIPVHGQVEYTYRCLRSLWSHRSHYSFEVIVVDDCSTDNTASVLASIAGLRVVRNDLNLGYLRSCNTGAQHALGKLLVLLNNDTIVLPSWLDELVETFNAIPRAGLVGSKLLYPDGTLQEAGGIIWKDGSGWNYGRNQDPHDSDYSYLRDVDYCSGASLAICKALFDQLGGFDEHYMPAYGEDSDLAFRVRQAGYRVLYQPLSQLVHFEGVTSGTDTASGAKAYQIENAEKLYRRWQSLLMDHGQPGIDVRRERERVIVGRALVLDHCTPTPDQDAGSITAVNLMRILQALGFKVTFIPEDNFQFTNAYTQQLQRIGIECLYAPYTTSVEQHLRDHGAEYDLVLVFRFLAAERNLAAVTRYCGGAKVIFHTSDLHHLREMREAELAASEKLRRVALQTRDRELAVIRAVDATIVHSTAEKALLDQELSFGDQASRVFLFPWAIDIPGSESTFADRDGMVFVGGFQHQPNVDAVHYFVNDIFPLVRDRLPDAVFRIVGSRCTPEIYGLADRPGIEVLGFVKDLGEVLDACKLSVIALRYGAGIKGKIATCLSYALPCVSTSIGAEGMELGDGDGVLVEDEAKAFADAVVRLHQDPHLWAGLSEGGLEFAIRNYSLSAGIDIVRYILESIGYPGSKIGEAEVCSFAGLSQASEAMFRVDQIDDPLEVCVDLRTHSEYERWAADPLLSAQREIEAQIAHAHRDSDSYTVPGYCRVCEKGTDFFVDKQSGSIQGSDMWLPNWRERLVCPICGLNNRQRAIAYAASKILSRYRDRRPEVYLMEQVTPIYSWITNSLPHALSTGSEYLGTEIAPGAIIDGIRHEDVEKLSFSQDSFDLILSNDVLEHVVDPGKALREAHRVLRSGGELLMSVPFHLDSQNSVRRAEVNQGKLNHLLPPVYHGNPVSDDGSLVFVDFGWDLLDEIRQSGFLDPRLCFYWSEVYGHLGPAQHYIHAVKAR